MSAAITDAFEIGLAGRESEFGKTWMAFLTALSVPQIHQAEKALASRLQMDRLDHKRVLEIGSGAGLLSLAARRRGASVFSFDLDPQAVACARELRLRYFPGDVDWQIEDGSVLDPAFLKTLDTFDVVIADNALNHTGAMIQALENVKPLVAVGGQLHVSIYNDYREISDRWDHLKGIYKKLPRPLGFLFGLGLIARSEARLLLAHRRQRSVRHWLRSWVERDHARGISRWREWKAWLDAYPYERASVEEVVELFGKDGFRLISTTPPRSILECVGFVFQRDRPVGLPADPYTLRGRTRAPRQLNSDAMFRRVTEPWTLTEAGWTGTIADTSEFEPGTQFALFRDGALVGPVPVEGAQAVVGLPDESASAISQVDFYVVVGEARQLFPPFRHERGRMWSTGAVDLGGISDGIAHSFRSPVLLFENGHQLRKPHAPHEEIAHRGGGHFSHWENTIYFSTSDGSDPNFNGNSYAILVGGDRKRHAPEAAANPERDENGELIVTPEMISAGLAVLEDWERSQARGQENDSPPPSSAAKVKLVSTLYKAMRTQI